MIKPDKLIVATDLTGRSVADVDGVLYFWGGNEELTTEALDAETLAQVESEYQSRLSAYESTQYMRNRASEYPPITDYLDGVVKGDQAQIDAYIAACQAVKAKYPKGE